MTIKLAHSGVNIMVEMTKRLKKVIENNCGSANVQIIACYLYLHDNVLGFSSNNACICLHTVSVAVYIQYISLYHFNLCFAFQMCICLFQVFIELKKCTA